MSAKLAPVITIDGPGGTGKGTLCHLVAKKLGWHLLDSGSLYRVLALAALKGEVSLDNEPQLAILGQNLNVCFLSPDSDLPRILLDGEDVTQDVRSEECGAAASKIAAFATVRQALLERQRAFRDFPGLVTDGRDMGTVIFPDAVIKIFLEASCEERAKRRHIQLKQQGINVSLQAILQDLQERDERDKNRAVAPLQPASDAVVVDSSRMAIAQVFECVMDIIKSRGVR